MSPPSPSAPVTRLPLRLIPRPRHFIEFDDSGKTLFLAQPKAGTILAMSDKDGDGTFEASAKFITGKPTAHGMHFKDGWLWFTQSQAIYKARDTNGDGVADETITIAENLPARLATGGAPSL